MLDAPAEKPKEKTFEPLGNNQAEVFAETLVDRLSKSIVEVTVRRR